MILRLLILAIQLKKLPTTKKIDKEKRLNNHDKYITTHKIHKLTSEHFAARLAKVKLNKRKQLLL